MLSHDEDRFRYVLQATRDVIYDWDIRGRRLWRDDIQPLSRCSEPCECTGVSMWAAHIHPDDRPRTIERLTRAFERRESQWKDEYRCRLDDGSSLRVWDRGHVIYEEGAPVRMVGALTDLTERERTIEDLRFSEARYRALVSAASHAVWAHTEDVTPTSMNDGAQWWEELTGQPPSVTGAWGWLEVLHPDDRFWVKEHWTKCLAEKTPFDVEYRVLSREGVYHNVHVRGVPIHGPNDVVREWVGMFSDVTERRQLEEQLRHVHKMEAVGQLAGGVAHDFNNVLTVIQGFSDLVLRELPADDDLAQSISEIKKAGERAAELTRQLLAFSRKTVIRPVVLDLNGVLTDAENMLRRLIGEDIELTLELEADLWKVKVDPVQVDQILLNLAANSRDAMPDGGKLTLETRNVVISGARAAFGKVALPPGRYVRLSVADTGHGMESSTIERIFEPFFTTKAPGRGTGMGLAAVYGIVQQFGGHIDVVSRLREGTSFLIYLTPQEEEKVEEAPLALAPPPPRGRETLILVEDDDSVRALTRHVLVRQGYGVLEARDGLEAIRLCTEHTGHIDLLVTDVVMPHMSGMQVAEEIKKLRPGIRTLFVSGYLDDALGVRGVLDADIALLQKPFTPATLAVAVRSVLDRP